MRCLLVVVAVLSGCGKVQMLSDAPNGSGTGTDASTSGDAKPVCGNGIVDPGETCDGNCPVCGTPAFSCFLNTGSPSTCDVRCNVPITACAGADGCCPFAQGGNECTSTDDGECAGTGWKENEWGTLSWGGATPCTVARVYGISSGDSILFTLCTPPGAAAAIGDPQITSIIDSSGMNYFPSLSPVNDDTKDPSAIPLLAGWSCKTDVSATAASTAPENDGGLIIAPSSNRIDVTICGANGTTGSGALYIWWNGVGFPNAG
jgi:hypothetical protein